MPNLVVNSGARIQALVRNGKVDISVEAAIPGRGIRRTTLSEERQPEVVAFLRRVGTATEAEFNLFSEQEIDLLREFGILVPEPDAPGTIPLDLTLRKREAPQAAPQVLIEDLQKNLPNIPLRIPEGGRVIWVRDAVRDVWFPNVLDRRQLEGVQRLMNGGSRNELGAEICEDLSEDVILHKSARTQRVSRMWRHPTP